MDPLSALVLVAPLYGYLMLWLSARSVLPVAQPASAERIFVVMVACLNEEQVIEKTLERLLALRGRLLVLIVDDDSDDRSVGLIRPWLTDPRVELLQRRRPAARTGKGAVLNAGLKRIEELKLSERFGAENVIVGVFDADGRVDPGFLEAVDPYFEDAKIAGVQSGVRMYNAELNLLTRWQNMEFTVWGQVISRAKDWIGSATLGGNGQFARLSALRELGPAPWRPSLTEDLDLSVRLILNGWRIRFCSGLAVYQEAIPTFRPLVRQRARWMQGHLVSWQYLANVLVAPLPVSRRVDLAVFLVLPALLLPVGVLTVVGWTQIIGALEQVTPVGVLAWYLVSFSLVPLVLAARARASGENYIATWAHAHLFAAYGAIWFVSSVWAIWNVLLGHRGWTKTSRVVTSQLTRPRGMRRPAVAALVMLLSVTMLVGLAAAGNARSGGVDAPSYPPTEPLPRTIVPVPAIDPAAPVHNAADQRPASTHDAGV